MNLEETILTSIVTSSIVSAVAIFILKTYLQARISHRFEVEKERVKFELAIQLNLEKEIQQRKLKAYPLISSLVYKIRNFARDILKKIKQGKKIGIDDFLEEVSKLEESLYDYRIDLEADGLFKDIHTYKNLVLSFNIIVQDIFYCIEQGDVDGRSKFILKLNNLYSEINKKHELIVTSLSTKTYKK